MKPFSQHWNVCLRWPTVWPFAIGLWVALLLGGAFAQTSAGSVIRNQASATVGGETYLSNTVETLVQAICVPLLTPNGSQSLPAQRAVISSSGAAYFTYLVRNGGNAPFDFSLGHLLGVNDWVPSEVHFYLDVNENSRRNTGEPEITQLSLAPDQQVRIVMEVIAPAQVAGNTYITPTLSCASGPSDQDNHSLVTVGAGPALNVSKEVSLKQVREGQELTYTITVANLGTVAASGPVTVYDALDSAQLQGMRYVEGSASAPKGHLEYRHGSGPWQSLTPSTPASEVQALQLVLDGLQSGEQAVLSFRVRVENGAVAGLRRNVVRVEGPGGPAEAAVELSILPRYGHRLGPVGNPTASGTADQQRAEVPIGQSSYCFSQTLQNTGNLVDRYTLTAENLPAGVNLSLRNAQGPLAQPVVLQAGQSLDFQACLSNLPANVAAFEFSLVATSVTLGDTDPTLDRVSMVFSAQSLVLRKTSDVQTASPGERVSYTLEVQNPLPIALSDVAIEDPLDERLEFISASDAGSYEASSRTVRWRLARLEAGQKISLQLQTKVAAKASDGPVPNLFSLRSAEFPEGVSSTPVNVEVLSSSLLMQKEVSPKTANYGDILNYRITVVNSGKVPLEVRLTDLPSLGLQYVLGSARLDGIGSEPRQVERELVWDRVMLSPGQEVVLTYRMRVVAGASQDLNNTASAVGANGNGVAVAAAAAAAAARLERGVFEPANTLVGRVFLDSNRDGLFTAGTDVPLPGARIVLSNGLQALTDGQGRYSFRSLQSGVWEVLLDPASAPFKVLPHPERMGDGYRHRVRVEGLTQSDFPLERPVGMATGMRETTLVFGPLMVQKKLMPLPNGIRVVLELSSSTLLEDFTLLDPLPGGGQQEFKFNSFQGQKTLTYDLPSMRLGQAMTDPQARWKYP